MKTRILLATIFSTFLFVIPAYAHPGHGEEHASGATMHYMLEPVHFIPLVIAVTLLFCIFLIGRQTGAIGRFFSSEK